MCLFFSSVAKDNHQNDASIIGFLINNRRRYDISTKKNNNKNSRNNK